MTVESVDVAIIGAGPAGSAAAHRLAEKGLRVALLDRHRFPRPKTCGDGLTPRAMELLEHMGVVDELRPYPSIDSIVSVDLFAEEALRSRLPRRGETARCGRTVPRTVLDEALRRSAGRAGALLLDETEARTLRRDGTRVVGVDAVSPTGPVRVDAAVTIVAEGAAGRLARTVVRPARRQASGIAVRQYFTVPGPIEPSFRVYLPLPGAGMPLCGYGWVFPAGDRLLNVGVGAFFEPGSERRDRIRSIFELFVGRLRDIEPFMRHAASCGVVEGGIIPIGLRAHGSDVHGMLLVGDAVGVPNPFTGEGISQAIESGRLAAECAAEHLDSRRPLASTYTERLRAAFPSAGRLADWLPWLAERGGIRSREFWGILASDGDLAHHALRAMVVEEPPVAHPPIDRNTRDAWDAALRHVHAAHPLLVEYLRSIEAEVIVRIDTLLRRSWSAIPADGADLAVPIVLLTVVWILAGEVRARSESTGIGARSSWARNAFTLGALDLLLARTFASLASVPRSHAIAFAELAGRLFSNRLAAHLTRADLDPLDEEFRATLDDLVGLVRADAAAKRANVEPPCAPV